MCGDVLDVVRNPKKPGGNVDNSGLDVKESWTRELRLFMRVKCMMTEASKAKVLAAFPDARLVQLEGEAFADEFALVTELGNEKELLGKAAELSEMLPCGAPIRYLSL